MRITAKIRPMLCAVFLLALLLIGCQSTEPNSPASETEIETDMDIQSAQGFIENGDTGWITFSRNNTNYLGIYNTKGEVFYCFEPRKQEGWKIEYAMDPCGKDSVLITETRTAESGTTHWWIYNYTVVNHKGEVTFSSTDRNGYDEVIGYGDGLFMVYKNTGGFSKNECSYGTVDSNGNWVDPLAPGPDFLSDYDAWTQQPDRFELINDGVFGFRGARNTYGTYFEKELYYQIDSHTFDEMPGKDALAGTVSLSVYYDDQDSDKRYLSITNHTSMKTRLYSNLELKQISAIYADGQWLSPKTAFYNEWIWTDSHLVGANPVHSEPLILRTTGADGKTYFLPIDFQGEELGEPIQADQCTVLTNEYIAYKIGNYWQVRDLKGQVIVGTDRCYTAITAFHNRYATGKGANGTEIFDTSGQVITLPNEGYSMESTLLHADGIVLVSADEVPYCLMDISTGQAIHFHLSEQLRAALTKSSS